MDLEGSPSVTRVKQNYLVESGRMQPDLIKKEFLLEVVESISDVIWKHEPPLRGCLETPSI